MVASDYSKVLVEFIDSNMDKTYPLSDECLGDGGFTMPTSFIADLKLYIGTMDNRGEDSYRFHTRISNVSVYSDYIYVTISCTMDGVTKQIARSNPIPTTIGVGDDIDTKTIHINPIGSVPVNGVLTVGTCQDINNMPGSWDIDDNSGLIFPANVMVSPDTVTGLIVDGQRLTGDVTLVAGDNVKLEYDETANSITLSIVPSEDESSSAVLSTEDLMKAIVSKYGQPVVTINELPPDEKGNIQINPTDCLMVEINPVAHTISFYNPCGSTCVSEEFMSDTYTRISDLNRSYATLVSFYNSVANTLAQMGVRVSAVLENK